MDPGQMPEREWNPQVVEWLHEVADAGVTNIFGITMALWTGGHLLDDDEQAETAVVYWVTTTAREEGLGDFSAADVDSAWNALVNKWKSVISEPSLVTDESDPVGDTDDFPQPKLSEQQIIESWPRFVNACLQADNVVDAMTHVRAVADELTYVISHDAELTRAWESTEFQRRFGVVIAALGWEESVSESTTRDRWPDLMVLGGLLRDGWIWVPEIPNGPSGFSAFDDPDAWESDSGSAQGSDYKRRRVLEANTPAVPSGAGQVEAANATWSLAALDSLDRAFIFAAVAGKEAGVKLARELGTAKGTMYARLKKMSSSFGLDLEPTHMMAALRKAVRVGNLPPVDSPRWASLPPADPSIGLRSKLTEIEKWIFAAAVAGFASPQEIATELGLSPSTVNTALDNLGAIHYLDVHGMKVLPELQRLVQNNKLYSPYRWPPPPGLKLGRHK